MLPLILKWSKKGNYHELSTFCVSVIDLILYHHGTFIHDSFDALYVNTVGKRSKFSCEVEGYTCKKKTDW